MKKILALALSLAAGLSFAAQPLLTPAELSAQLRNPAVRVIDIRDPKAYSAQHIPGAVNAPYGKWRGPASNPGELPELPKLTALVQSLGLSPATHAVVVSSGADSTDFGASARVYWTLKVLGLKELSILNGGVKAWAQAQLPQDSTAVSVAASAYAPQLDASLIAGRDQVAQKAGSGAAVLVDARPAEFFRGETRHPAARLAGTIEGAVNLEHSRFFDGNSALFVPEKARQASTSIDPKKETVAFCNTGHWAATDWFALSEIAGHKNVSLYPGSMVDWTQDPKGLPVGNAPGRAKQLLIDAKLWSERTFK